MDSIWAVGDVTDRINLTPVALMEGGAFAKTLFGDEPTKPEYRYLIIYQLTTRNLENHMVQAMVVLEMMYTLLVDHEWLPLLMIVYRTSFDLIFISLFFTFRKYCGFLKLW